LALERRTALIAWGKPGKWKKYKQVNVKRLALAMFYSAISCQAGTHIYESDQLACIF